MGRPSTKPKPRQPKGHGSVTQLPSGKYRARWREDGRPLSAVFPTAEKAQDFLIGQRADIARGVHIPRAKSQLTFSEVGEEWLQTLGHLGWRARRDYPAIYRRALVPHFGKLTIGEIDKHAVNKFLTQLGQTRASATVRKHRAVLRLVFAAAIDMKAIHVNPCVGTKIARGPQEEVVPLSEDEVARVLEVIDPRYRLVVLIGAFCGLRAGEIWALRRKSVDFEGATLRISRSDPIGNDPEADDMTKSKTSVRTVPVPASVIKVIREHMVAFGPGPDGRIFRAPKGGRVDHNNFYDRVWTKAIEKAQIERQPVFHDLRHTFVAFKFSRGATVEQVRRWLGHSNQQMTEKYSHLFPKEQAGADLDDIVSAVVTRSVTDSGTVLKMSEVK